MGSIRVRNNQLLDFRDEGVSEFNSNTNRPAIDNQNSRKYNAQMFKTLVKFSALFVVLFSFFLLTGTITASATIAGAVEVDLCCDAHDDEQPMSSNEGECSDPGCRCPACTFSTLEFHQLPVNVAQQSAGQSWLLASNSPSDYIRLIDYPPERL